VANVGLSGTSHITARFKDDPDFSAWNNLTESQACSIAIEPIGKVVLAMLLTAQSMDSALNVYLVPTDSNFWILTNAQVEPVN
jgi:isochorismate synthase EntC